jgi:hypothetical protein
MGTWGRWVLSNRTGVVLWFLKNSGSCLECKIGRSNHVVFFHLCVICYLLLSLDFGCGFSRILEGNSNHSSYKCSLDAFADKTHH